MHNYQLTENQRQEIEMIMTTCFVSMMKMRAEMKAISPAELAQFKRAEAMYRQYIELFRATDGSQSPLNKFGFHL